MLQTFDERNKNIKIFIGGKLFSREEAKVSVFDSSVQGGDAVWEGLRIYNGRIFCFDLHVKRLRESAIAFPSISTGVYGFPIERASRIALQEMLDFLAGNKAVKEVIACCYSAHDLRVYQAALVEISASGNAGQQE